MKVFQHWPNRITAVRFLGALVLFVVYTIAGDRQAVELEQEHTFGFITFWLFTIVALTDFLDGYLARKGNLISVFGRIADPFVDKVLLLGAMIYMAVMPWSQRFFPAWVVVVILAREFLVTGIRGYVESVGKEFGADLFGKIKMIVQCMAVGGVMWLYAWPWPEGWFAFWQGLNYVLVALTVLTTIGSGANYVLKTNRILAEREDDT